MVDGQELEAVWCFCGQSIPFRQAAVLVLYRNSESTESGQNLYAHKQCLRDRVLAEIDLDTELPDE